MRQLPREHADVGVKTEPNYECFWVRESAAEDFVESFAELERDEIDEESSLLTADLDQAWIRRVVGGELRSPLRIDADERLAQKLL